MLFGVTLKFVIFESTFSGMYCVERYVVKKWRAHGGHHSEPGG